MTNKVLHAFPSPSAFTSDGDTLESGYDGMTLRDYFAAKAMAAMIAQYPCQAIDKADGGMNIDFQALAGDAYQMADEMLATRQL